MTSSLLSPRRNPTARGGSQKCSRKVVVTVILFTFFIAQPVFSVAQAASTRRPHFGLSIDGALCNLIVVPGQTYQHIIQITNDPNSAEVVVRLEVKELGQDLFGSYVPLSNTAPGPLSARDWITSIDRSEMILQPGRSAKATVTIQTPLGIGGETRYAAVHIYSGQTGEQTAGLGTQTTYLVPIVLTPQGLRPVDIGQILGVEVERAAADQPFKFKVSYKNSGNYHYRARGQVLVKDTAGAILSTLDLPVSSTSLIPSFPHQFEVAYTAVEVFLRQDTVLLVRIYHENGNLLDQREFVHQAQSPTATPSITFTATPSVASTVRATEKPHSPSATPRPGGSGGGAGSAPTRTANVTQIVAVVVTRANLTPSPTGTVVGTPTQTVSQTPHQGSPTARAPRAGRQEDAMPSVGNRWRIFWIGSGLVGILIGIWIILRHRLRMAGHLWWGLS